MTRHPLHPRSSRARRGFTFIEVLFAIIIMGIGSIMIAGMLPVAIKQTSDTRNAITGKAACEAGYAYIQAIATTANLPATNNAENAVNGTKISTALGPVDSFVTFMDAAPAGTAGKVIPLSAKLLATGATIEPFDPFRSTLGSRVLGSDPRTQWLAFYSRDSGSNLAKLIVLALHLQNAEGVVGTTTISQYAGIGPSPTFTPYSTLTNADNGPLLLRASIVDGGALDADRITLTNAYSNNGLLAAETGAFVIVANSPAATATSTEPDAPNRPSRNNGRVFRLGKLRPDLESPPGGGDPVYELQPGYDLPPAGVGADGLPNTPDDVADASMDSSTQTQVWIVGKGLQNPAAAFSAANPYVGLVQDVSVLTTQLSLNNP